MPTLDEITLRLAPMGPVEARRMFGAHGLFWQGVMFGIAHGNRLYFKVDSESRGLYEARGMLPFRPSERQTSKSYYEVPDDVFSDAESLRSWAGAAIRAGQAKR